MTGNPVALDTNQAIAILNGVEGIDRWAASLWAACLPVPVLGELRYGAMNSQRPDENLAAVERLAACCRVIAADAATAVVYAKTRLQLKRAGTPIPENDVWIAAICLQHELPLATSDRHFASVEGLAVLAR